MEIADRIEWVDVAKGIGIILVILGHTITLAYSYPIYAFHMPLFFFLSGLVYKDKKESLMFFLKRTTNSLLRPWFIMLTISLFICLLIPTWRNGISLYAVLEDLYTSNTDSFQNSSLWYLVCYFFVLLFWFWGHQFFSKSVGFIFLIILALLFLRLKTILMLTGLPYNRLPFKMDSAMIAFVFFFIAYNFKNKIFYMICKFDNKLLIISLCFLTILLCFKNGWSNINSLDFGNIKLLYYPIALLGVFSVILISKWISNNPTNFIKNTLVFYGRYSLLIFGFQSLFIRLYLLFFNNIQDLSMKLYESNPIAHQIGSFIVVTFILSPLIVYVFLFLRKKEIYLL